MHPLIKLSSTIIIICVFLEKGLICRNKTFIVTAKMNLLYFVFIVYLRLQFNPLIYIYMLIYMYTCVYNKL